MSKQSKQDQWDCTDGKINMARLLSVGAALFNVDLSKHTFPPQQALVDWLRAVKP